MLCLHHKKCSKTSPRYKLLATRTNRREICSLIQEPETAGNLKMKSVVFDHPQVRTADLLFSVSAGETEKMIHEWDGLTRYLDSVMSRFFKVENYEVSRHTSASYKGR